jgi:isocitrate/isopropylmalate dehydrogenase
MGEAEAADRILHAIRTVIGKGEKVTYDIKRSVTGSAAGSVGTQAYADALVEAL